MELKTYTNLWSVEKRLYKFYDINLPYPVSIRQIGIFISITVPWLMAMTFLGVPFSAPWNVFWIAPPIVITWYANKPVAEGKTLVNYAGSQLSYFFGPRKYSDLKPETESTKPDEIIHVKSTVWRKEMSDE